MEFTASAYQKPTPDHGADVSEGHFDLINLNLFLALAYANAIAQLKLMTPRFFVVSPTELNHSQLLSSGSKVTRRYFIFSAKPVE